LELNNGIRFAGIADKKAQLVGHAYRNGLRPLLTPKETEISVLQSVIRNGTRTTFEKKLGKTVFSYMVYEKVKRVTIPMKSGSDHLFILVVSFDPDVHAEPIVVHEIMPLLNELLA
jgi:hypothetical protein